MWLRADGGRVYARTRLEGVPCGNWLSAVGAVGIALYAAWSSFAACFAGLPAVSSPELSLPVPLSE